MMTETASLYDLLLNGSKDEVQHLIRFRRYRRPPAADIDQIIELWRSDIRYDGNHRLKTALKKTFLKDETNPFPASEYSQGELFPDKNVFAKAVIADGYSAHHVRQMIRMSHQCFPDFRELTAFKLWNILKHMTICDKGNPARLMQSVKIAWMTNQNEMFFQQNLKNWSAWLQSVLEKE